MNSNAISKLDASMIRCGVRFTFDYQFQGSVDTEPLQHSVNHVMSKLARFNCRMDLLDKYEGQWQNFSKSMNWFRVEQLADLNNSLTTTYERVGPTQNCIELPPMFFTLFHSANKPNSFVLQQCGAHSYCDGKSAITLFNLVLQYYSALVTKDRATQKAITDQLNGFETPAPDAIFKRLTLGRWSHIKNIFSLMSYKTSDAPQYATPHRALPDLLKHYNTEPSQPIMRSFFIAPIIDYCKQHCPNISPHNLVCALLAKANYSLSKQLQRPLKKHQVSFRVMVDIINAPQRRKLLGNYIAYLPVTIDGRQSLKQIAHAINERLLQARLSRADVSMYKLLEFALGSGMANKSNDPVSYIVANIDNFSLKLNPEMLTGACLSQFQASANAVVLDEGGAQLNNRPTICFSLSTDHQLLVSFFNTLSEVDVQQQWLDKIEQEIQDIKTSFGKISNHKPNYA